MIRNRPRLLYAYLLAAGFAFAQRGAPILQQLTFTPYHAGGIYDVGETVGWTVTPGPVTPTYAYKWSIRRNNAVVLKEGKLDLSSGTDKIEITGDEPEMIYVAVEAYAKLAPMRPRLTPRRRPPVRDAAHRPLSPAATRDATTGFTRSEPPSHPPRSACRRRVPKTSTRSGTANSPRRQRSRSTPF
jgi:hypothetical protein